MRGFDTVGDHHEERATRCIRCGDCITGRQEPVPSLAQTQKHGSFAKEVAHTTRFTKS